jgi:hypothetical protein
MKTTIVAALLLASLAFAGTALAGPVEDAEAIASCAASIPGPDGQTEHVNRLDTGVDVIDQDHPCTD